MAITAVKMLPKNPEIWPLGGGLVAETWTLTGDGSSTTYTLTSDAVRRILTAPNGTITHNISASTTNQIVLTFPAAPGNGLLLDVWVIGKT